jgi:hypothetical protein
VSNNAAEVYGRPVEYTGAHSLKANAICRTWSPRLSSVWLGAGLFGIVWVSRMWMYFTEVRPLSAEQSSKHPEPTYFS